MADDYKTKIDQFLDLVPKSARMTSNNPKMKLEYYGEILSGKPVIPIPKGEPARQKAKDLIGTTAFSNSDDFTAVTGLTHSHLMSVWKDNSIETSCNAFVGRITQKMGISGLGGFYVEKILTKMGKQHCWVTPASGETPQYGDVFETQSVTPGAGYVNLHVGISLAVDGGTWYTIEGGQGGPGAGADKVARIKKPYKVDDLLGWVDMRSLVSGKPPLPDWLVGDWMITAGTKNYVYSFNARGKITQKAYQPLAGNDAPVPVLDTGGLFSIVGDAVRVRWNGEGGVESFTYDRWNSFPGVNERMSGEAADGTAMQGVRL